MINELAEFLMDQPRDQGYWPTADKILNFLENKGMCPPLSEETYVNVLGEKMTGKKFVYKWEV